MNQEDYPLRESETRYRLLVDHCSDLMWNLSSDGIFLDLSASWARVTGYKPSSLIGTSFVSIVHPDDAAACSEYLHNVLTSREVLQSPEYRVRHADGTWHWHIATSTPVLGPEGASISMVGVSRDITEHKQAEEDLRQSQEQFRVMFDTASVGMAQADPQTGRWLRVNRKMCEITGYSSDEILGMRVSEIVHPEYREQSRNAFQRVVRGEVPDFRLEKRYIRKDGRGIWVNVNVAVIRDAEGQAVRTMATIEEISSRKEAEEKLRQSEENFKKIFHTNQDSISVNRISDGAYSMINKGFIEVTGYAEADVIGKTALDINIWENPEDRERLLEGLQRDGKVENLDTKFRRKDGDINYAIMSASMIDLNGSPHILSVSRDISDRRRAEERLRESEEKYRILVENAVEAIFIIQDGIMKFVNAETAKIFGYSKEDLVSRPFTDFIHPEDRELVLNRYLDRQHGKEAPSRYPFRLLDASGEKRWVEVNAVFVEWEGKPATLNFMNDITARKRVEDSLRKSDERYRILAANASDIIWSVNMDLKVTYVSPAVERLKGWTREERKALTVQEIMPPASLEKVMKILGDELAAEGSPDADPKRTLTVELEMYRKDGTSFWAEVKASFLRDEEGRPAGIMGITRDITERKQAEEALKQSEAKFRAIVENTHDGILFTDAQGGILYRSPSYQAITGYTNEERLGRPSFEMLHPDDMEEAGRIWRKMLGHPGILLEVQYRTRHEDGTWRWVETHIQNLLDNPNVQAVFMTTRDVTERKQAEEALRKSEALLRSVFKVAPIGLCVMENRVFRNVNKAWYENLGYSESEIIGHTPRIVYESEEEYERVGQKLFANLWKDGLASVQTTHKNKNGEIRDVILTAVPLSSPDGYPEMDIVTVEDITSHKRLEERLQRAEKMEALGTLAGGVAHDLNNVMGIVTGYAELLLHTIEKSNPLRPQLANIMEAGRRASAIVQDLLTMARRGVYNRRVLNLNKIVSDCLKSPEFEKLSTYHPAVKINMELEPDVLNISGSPVHLSKSLFNLISNASEAMPNGGAVTVRTGNKYMEMPVQGYDQIEEGDYVVLSVCDTGEGIPQADLKRIFEPFYTKKVMGRSGTGLGLAVVWGTVKDHNGYINVQSEQGKGSTFTLYFPVTRDEIKPETIALSMSEYMGRGESILVVDDIKGQRELATGILRKLNYRATSVSCGEEAVAYLRAHAVDLLVLDMIMEPGMDGLDTYRKVLEINPRQKAIIVSGFSESDRVHAAQDLGAGAYVRKPYAIEKLGMAVRGELDRK